MPTCLIKQSASVSDSTIPIHLSIELGENGIFIYNDASTSNLTIPYACWETVVKAVDTLLKTEAKQL